ncbi:MAG: PRC-barrel domain-containing protein [Mangrovicoccus sp.]|nr:PRC-barrel domain-containing protein [Mangrovicoccus sp.]
MKAAGEAATGAAAEAAVEGAQGAARTLGEKLQGAADKAKEAADAAKAAAAAAAVAAKTAADQVAADARNIAENATTVVGLDGQAFQLDGDTVLSSSLTGKTVTTSDGAEAGTISDLIISLDGRVEGIILNMGGLVGFGGRNVAVGVDRLQIREVIAGVPQLEIDATKAALDATPEFAPVKAP